jgi:multidrug efflux pump subunit AcrA (membrane-fusion protein)
LDVGVVVDGKVELRKLDVEADNGSDLEARGGLKPGDHVILNPPVNVTDGMRVRAG